MKHKSSFSLKRTFVVLGLAVLLSPATAFAEGGNATKQPASVMQTKTVRGHVVDETGEPLIGVTVKVVGTVGGGAITDLDGNFTIEVPAGAQLELSYTGFRTLTVAAKDGTFQMEPDELGLERS